MNFKITGKHDGKSVVEFESEHPDYGTRAHLSDVDLAKVRKDHRELTTNDAWPNRPDSEPAKVDAKTGDLKAVLSRLEAVEGKAEEQGAKIERLEKALKDAADAKTK